MQRVVERRCRRCSRCACERMRTAEAQTVGPSQQRPAVPSALPAVRVTVDDVQHPARRHRPDAVRDAGRAGVHGRRGVPRPGRAHADRRRSASSAWSARRVSSVLLWNRNAAGFGVIAADNFGLFVTLVLVVVGMLTIMFSSQVLERDGMPAGEYYALVLFSIVGMMMMATATDLLVIFVALEILSLAVYVLTGIRRDDHAGHRSGVQVLPARRVLERVLPLRHRLHLRRDRQHAARRAVGAYLSAQSMSDNPMILLALGLLLVGFAFKISAVPFHMWTPDAYEGAPAIVTGFMSTGVKAAAFAAFARVFLSAFEPFKADWAPVVWRASRPRR